MPRTKKTEPAKPEKKIVPDDALLRRFAAMPEDVQRMVLAYAQGVENGKKLAQGA